MGGGGAESSRIDCDAKAHLSALEFQYDWLMIEMFDQMVRMHSGGAMAECFRSVAASKNIPQADFIRQRVGENLLVQTPQQSHFLHTITFDKIKGKILNLYLKLLYAITPRGIRDEVFIRTSIGERHKWAYDTFSLHRLLAQAGYTNIQPMDYNQSQIPHFNTYLLDINADGAAYKGVSSIYMEARA